MTTSLNAGPDRLPPVTQDQPPPERVPGGVDVIADLAALVATRGTAVLDGRTADIVTLLLSRCVPADVPSRARVAWLCGELSERRRLGIARYGTPLQAGNGRDPEADLRQELFDAAAYSHQAELERKQQAELRAASKAGPPADYCIIQEDGTRAGCGRKVRT